MCEMSKVAADAVRYGSLGGAIQAVHDEVNAQQVASEDAVVVAASIGDVKDDDATVERRCG